MINERLCFYCDTFDGDFWIDKDPERPVLLVAAGGSEHAFKFTPLIGKITANVPEGKLNAYAQRFKWRARGDLHAEEARATQEGVRTTDCGEKPQSFVHHFVQNLTPFSYSLLRPEIFL